MNPQSNIIEMRQPETATFEDFWTQYPRRTGKAMARAKFQAITNGGIQTRALDRDSGQYVALVLEATPEELVAAAKAYRKSLIGPDFRLKIDEQFIPLASTWLNQGRFEDFT